MSHPHEYDSLLKYLAEHYPAALASWLLGRPVPHVRVLKSELSLQPIRADAVHLLEIDDEILHVEFETAPTKSEPPLELRMLDYFVRVYRRERKLVRQVVIVLAETKAHIPEEFHVGDTWHRYRVIRMREQDPEPLLAHEGLWPLAVLARSEHPEELLVEVAEKVSKIADESQRNDLTAAAAILAGLRFERELVRRMFRREIMMQSVIYREILQEGEQVGEQRGIQIGEQRGIQIGEQRGELHGRLAVVERQLKHRCGTLPAELQEQVAALSSPELDQLSEAVLDFNSAADLIRWLEQLHA
jgi:predicted transposase YdaD